MPKPTLVRLGSISLPELGHFRPFAPNWLTAYSIVITLWGYSIYQTHTALGVWIAVFGGMLDHLDGKMAFNLGQNLSSPLTWTQGMMNQVFGETTDAQKVTRNKRLGAAKTWVGQLWIEMNFPGGTDLGKVFDPFGDKLKSLTIMFCMADAGLLSPWLVGILAIPELAGTVTRRPFYYFQRFTQDSKATAVGKYKALAQWVAIILCIPFQKHWLSPGDSAFEAKWALNWILGLTILLAFASVASRFKWVRRQREVKEVLESLEKTTEHE
ncbi:CDP-alcohol phosphatidyltransferase family protein [Candidatus Peregrinibacteria bacterium]|nr:CDP-alcohol phosphatidyltransferase family protein [Candidatus Peregrinibacteria bacterium]